MTHLFNPFTDELPFTRVYLSYVLSLLFPLSLSEHVYSNVAYRQYTYWIRLKLGRQIPIDIPSRVVLKFWRASQEKVETVRTLNISTNSLAVLLDNINIIFGLQWYYSLKGF